MIKNRDLILYINGDFYTTDVDSIMKVDVLLQSTQCLMSALIFNNRCRDLDKFFKDYQVEGYPYQKHNVVFHYSLKISFHNVSFATGEITDICGDTGVG